MITIKNTDLKWNFKFLKNLNKLAQDFSIHNFLKKEAQSFKSQAIPKLPRNLGDRKKITNTPMSQSLEIAPIKKYKNGIKSGVGFNYINKNRIKYFYVMLAGYRTTRSGKKVRFKYSNRQAKSKILTKIWKKAKPTFNQRAKITAENAINNIYAKNKDF